MLALFVALALSEETLTKYGAILLLLLSIGAMLWSKFASLVQTIWADVTAAASAYERFRRNRS